MMRTIDRLSSEHYSQAESPRVDPRTGELAWIDMATGTFHRGTLAAGLRDTSSLVVGARIGAPAPLAGPGEGWVVAVDDGFTHIADDGTLTNVARGVAPAPAFFNDGGADPTGRFWAGTQSVPRAPRCALYSLETDGTVVERLAGVTVSNGLAFSADGRTLYYVDTLPNRSIEAFDVSPDGILSNRRTITAVTGGNPDGMAIDDEGALWVAVWDASQVRRYSDDGRLLEVIELPARRPTAVTLAGTTLVITTASVGLELPTPYDGALLAVEVRVGGGPALPWRGRV